MKFVISLPLSLLFLLPKFIFNIDLVPTAQCGNITLRHLARYFAFSMTNVKHKVILLDRINELLNKID